MHDIRMGTLHFVEKREKVMENFTEHFGSMLKTARRTAGFSQAAVALEVGVNVCTYGFCETGRKVPDLQTARELSKLLGLPGDVLLFPENYTAGIKK